MFHFVKYFFKKIHKLKDNFAMSTPKNLPSMEEKCCKVISWLHSGGPPRSRCNKVLSHRIVAF